MGKIDIFWRATFTLTLLEGQAQSRETVEGWEASCISKEGLKNYFNHDIGTYA